MTNDQKFKPFKTRDRDNRIRDSYLALFGLSDTDLKAKKELPPEPIVKPEGAALPRGKKGLFGPKKVRDRGPRKSAVGRVEGAESPPNRGEPEEIQPFRSVVQEGPQTPKQQPDSIETLESARTKKPARDPRNLVEQRNLVLAKAYNEAKDNKAKITAAALDKIPWITQDNLLIKWGELSFTGALENRPKTVKSLFSKTASRYKT